MLYSSIQAGKKRNQTMYNVGTVPRGMLTACILYD